MFPRYQQDPDTEQHEGEGARLRRGELFLHHLCFGVGFNGLAALRGVGGKPFVFPRNTRDRTSDGKRAHSRNRICTAERDRHRHEDVRAVKVRVPGKLQRRPSVAESVKVFPGVPRTKGFPAVVVNVQRVVSGYATYQALGKNSANIYW